MWFSQALIEIGQGHRLTRSGDGGEQYIGLQRPDAESVNTLPYLYEVTAGGHRVPWLPSQHDLFADDWVIVS